MASHRIEIINELRALEQFCTFKTVRSADEHNRFLTDYLADIQDYPLDAIQKACATWRRSAATKFPTPGQIIPLIRAALPNQTGAHAEPWRELSDAEYADLPLRAKCRHHLILAHQAQIKAGPMWRNTSLQTGRATGETIPPEEMPATHRKWNDIAAGHRAEAERLRQYMHRQPLAAE